MARGQVQRSSTLIDPESLQRPVSRHQESLGSQAPLGRKNSANTKPLLTFDDNQPGIKATLSPSPRTHNGRSVFGTDTLWEREMLKLKEIEAGEKMEKDAKEKRELEKAARIEKKRRKGKGKGKGKIEVEEEVDQGGLDTPVEPEPRVSLAPPVLPAIEKSTIQGPSPPVNDDDTESDSDESARQAPAKRKARRGSAETAADRWVAGSSDEDGPRRTTGIGLRNPTKGQTKSQFADDDSEEDMPLSVTMSRALQRALSSGGDDSDEDKPLSAMLDKAKTGIPPINFDKLSIGHGRNDDDDDQPLGLRASRMLPSSQLNTQLGDDDDNKPLAFHPDQQRRTQYQAMAQQQQMVMQAQMQQSMFFGPPSMMNSGFFGPPMAPMMGGPPMLSQQMAQAPPVPDAGKFNQVDRWRHDVAVNGQP